MNSDIGGRLPRVGAHPLLLILISFPIACFCCALVTDAVYAQTADILWSDFSDWLLAVGLGMGVLAAIAAIADAGAIRRARGMRPVIAVGLGGLIVLALAALNNFVHSRDAWTSVVPQGLGLSAITVVVIVITAWLGAAPAVLQDRVQYVEVRR
jgi:uncharacterized membrane protein